MRDQFRNFNTYKIDPLTEIRNAGIVTGGDVFWVSSVSDSEHRSRVDNLGRKVVKTSLQAAVNDAKNNHDDYILLVPTDSGTAVPLGTAVDVNKNRLHILGTDRRPAPRNYDSITLRGYVSANGIDTELMFVTGAGVELGGFKLLGTSGTAAGGTMTSHLLIGTASSGTPHDLWVHDVHVESTQAAADNGTADIVSITGNVGGGIKGIRFDNCWLGNRNWAPEAVVKMAGTAGPTRVDFYNTTFVIDAQATTDDFVVIGTGETDYINFENCKFINVEAGTKPASALTGAVLVDNPVHMINCFGNNVTAFGTDTEVFIAPNQAGTAGAGVHNPGIGFVGTSPVVVA